MKYTDRRHRALPQGLASVLLPAADRAPARSEAVVDVVAKRTDREGAGFGGSGHTPRQPKPHA